MNELIQSLQQKTGLTAEQASAAVSHVLEYFKSKLPDSVHGLLDHAASGTNVTDELKSKAETILASLTSKMGF
jgi:hypothetical protein